MANNPNKKAMTQAAADGSKAAGAMLRDMMEDEGQPSIDPVRGQWVFIETATHFFVGQVVDLNDEFIMLGPEVTQVFRTGSIETFCKEGVATECELYPAHRRVRRGGIIDVSDWPTAKHPHQG